MTSIPAAMLSCVLLVLETTADEGASAASAKLSQRSLSQQAPPPLGERQTRDPGSKVHIEMLKVKCLGIRFVSRDQWNAQPPKDVESLNNVVKLVLYHHTEEDECFSIENCSRIVRRWQFYHQVTKGWHDIAYQYLIGGDGSVYEGRSFGVVGAHTLSYNDKSVSIGFIGNFTYHVPNEEMLTSAQTLIDCGVALGKIHVNYTLHGQRDANKRDCPGNAFYHKIITQSLRFGGRLSPYID
uniref:Putative animal peptidoglycan recognition protein n=2 Tax=Ixodes ricinus TaxID=34613 RepID=V5H9X8_IXORI